jgi:2-keto-4-pentenoate hydratase
VNPVNSLVTRVQRAADLLLQARASRRPLGRLPDDAAPQSSREAYAIQDRVIDALGPLGGWKVGAKTPTDEPSCAPLCASWLVASPAHFAARAFALNGIEAEIAFRLARDLPARSNPYTPQDIVAAVASVHPVIEVVDSRFADIRAVDPLSLLADSLSHGALVIGTGIPLPDAFDVTAQTVDLDVDGTRVVSGRNSNTAGEPFRLLAWLANHAAGRCAGLRRDQVVTTGSWTGIRFVAPDARVEARFPGIGDVRVEL